MTIALSATGITHRFGDVVALHDVSLDVPAGECVALVGESGSGKTTLLRCFNRMVEPAGGVVRAGDAEVREQDVIALRRRIGYVQQHGGLLPHWNVADNVGLVLRADGARRGDPAYGDAVARALTFAGLDASVFGRRYPRQLSGGQRQRVALARAIARAPDALLLDEPFGALDAISKAEVQTAFADARGTLRLTTILVTHDLAEAARLSHDIVVMRAGQVEQRGSIAALRAAPRTEYVSALVTRAIDQLRVLEQA
jgi:osmoprotectant transport system ATP-binding protein